MLGFAKKSATQARVGLEVSAGMLSVACMEHGASPEFFHYPLEKPDELADQLASFVSQNKVDRWPCSVVLPIESYELMLLDKPVVTEEEMQQALKWKLKDRLPDDPETYVFEYFPLPEDAIRGGGEKIYAVVVKRDLVERIVSSVQRAHLELQSIDISELAVRNVIADLKQFTRGCAFLTLNDKKGSLYFYRSDNLYFSRDFEVVFTLDGDVDFDSLSLEIQRSMDYYERQMAQPVPEKVVCCVDSESENIIGNLKEAFRMQFETVDCCEKSAEEDAGHVSSRVNAFAGILEMQREPS